MRALLLLMLLADPALAKDPIRDLTPLVTLYGPGGSDLGFDVAGIRCAGLFAAQEKWAQTHPGTRGPTRAQKADVERNLTLAEQHRLNGGMGLVEAQESTRRDVLAVIAAFTRRFETNSSTGHPWNGDRLVKSDTAYCELLGGRR